MRYEVLIGDRRFEVEVLEVSPGKFEVVVNGKKAIIELSREISMRKSAKIVKEVKKEKKGDKAIKAPMVGVVTKILKKRGKL